MVYVLNKDGKPLMPTTRFGRVHHLLKEHKAVIVDYKPFTIKLIYETEDRTQEVSLGVDAGSKHVGFSATTKTRVLFEAQLELRTDIVKKLATRREFRRTRRYRKTRYRKTRFLNRTKSKKTGWLAPSIRNKIDSHIYWINKIHRFLPIVKTIVEVAQFDTQLLKAKEQGLPIPQGADYQHGEQLGFWNVREYVLFRDNYTCRCCKGKSKDPILNVHHIESRKTGGDAPNNLVTLCETCHKDYHSGNIKLPKSIKHGISFKDATFMGIMRRNLLNKLCEKYGNSVFHTYGYITKNTRIMNNLPKEHTIDARCISGNPNAKSIEHIYIIEKLRCHNRKLHKASILKGGIRKNNQAPKEVFGFRLMDYVCCDNKYYFINGRRLDGKFLLVSPTTIYSSKNVTYRKLWLLYHNHSYIVYKSATSD